MFPLMSRAFPAWSPVIIKGLSLSTSGILALADLTTSATRTALTGTSSWWDIFVLVPGLHIQQAAEAIGESHKGGTPEATSSVDDNKFQVTNTATTNYLQRISKANKGDRGPITVDVGATDWRSHTGLSFRSQNKTPNNENPVVWTMSAFLYALAPAMTFAATTLVILAQDWWGLGILISLMVARALNVFIIQRRTAEVPEVTDAPGSHVSWWVNLGNDDWICLRGLRRDLELITTGSWMRSKTNIEGYLEAGAKIIVYMVAVFSGNLTQMGDVILMALLLCSSAVLALSNASAGTFHMNGRTASRRGAIGEGLPARLSGLEDGSGIGMGSQKGRGVVSTGTEKQKAQAVSRSTDPRVDDVNIV